MCVHVFGNSPSPAIATYGLRKAAQLGEKTFGSDTKEFVKRDFYVDDGVTSLSTSEQAIDLLERTRKSLLLNGNLKLHKIASNEVKVMSAFPAAELMKPLRDLNLSTDMLPMQRSLGLYWDLDSVTFTFKVRSEEKPYTRRGVLSTVNSLFNPLGFASPITIQGKLLLRDLISKTIDWDEPLLQEWEVDWNKCKDSVKLLETLYTSTGLGCPSDKQVYVCADASEKVIAASAYLKIPHVTGNSGFSFILGKAEVSPLSAHTIPRLELCAVVLAVEISSIIVEQLGVGPDQVKYYTDSKVNLGYIYNESKRCKVFVTNRVSRIRRSSKPDQWSFVSTDNNCAKCWKLRGRQETPLMADLPSSRLEPSFPYSYVGVDSFGPWSVVTRTTRGGQAQAKRWAILFTCLTIRAIHLEVVEEMSSSSFINALRRFISICGNVVEFRSDRRSYFIGTTDDLKLNVISLESGDTKDFLYNCGTTWIFNPPHSPHMGGVWERLIGVTSMILDSMLSGASGKILTHEVLTTFLGEASAIVNARQIVPISGDAEVPEILSQQHFSPTKLVK